MRAETLTFMSIHRVQEARLPVHAGGDTDSIFPCRPPPQLEGPFLLAQLEHEADEVEPGGE